MSSPTSETLTSNIYDMRTRSCGATVGLFIDMRQYSNKHRLSPVLYALSLSTCVHNMPPVICPPVNIHPWRTVLCVTCLVCVFKQMGARTHAHQASPAFIHSFKHSLAVKLCFLTISFINPKSNGLVHDVCVKNICVCCSLRCLQMH